MNQERQARLFALAAVLLWSTVATAFKLSLRELEPAQLLFWANAFSLVVLGLLLAGQRRLPLLLRARRQQYFHAAILGFLNPFLYYTILFSAYDRLPAQVAQPLNYTWALTLSWLSIPLLHHRFRWRDLFAGLVCYGGVVVISTGGDFWHLSYDGTGIALALGSTLIWAFYWIFNTRGDLQPVVGLFLSFLIALPLVAIFAAWTGGFFPDASGGRMGSWILGALYVGIFEMGITYVLWLAAMKRTSNASRVANLIFLSPFLSLVFIQLVLGETIHPSTLAGLILIVLGLSAQHGGRARDLDPHHAAG
jgi:hypothetical protein